MTKPDITFNYLGDVKGSEGKDDSGSLFTLSDEFKGHEVDAGYQRNNLLTITGVMIGGALQVIISYSSKQFKNETIKRFADSYQHQLRSLIYSLLEESKRQSIDKAIWETEMPDALPLSFNQLNYFRNGHFLHAHGYFTLHLQEYDRSVFEQAYHQLFNDFAILRTRFFEKAGTVWQQIRESGEVKPPVRYIENISLDYNDPVIEAIRKEMTDIPFDLFQGETIRCGVIHNGNQAFIMLVIHHAVTDGVSNDILRDALLQRYNGRKVSKAVSYAGFIKAQQDYLDSEEGQSNLQYWENTLRPLVSRPRPEVKPNSIGDKVLACTKRTLITGIQFEQVNKYCKENEILLSSFLFSVLYYSTCRQPAVPFLAQIVNNGRNIQYPGFDIDGAVGQFVTYIPLLIDISEKMEFAAAIRCVQEKYLEATLHMHMPNRVIEDNFRKLYGLSPELLTDLVINYFDFSKADFSVTDLEIYQENYEHADSMPFTGVLAECQVYRDAILLNVTTRPGEDKVHDPFHFIGKPELIIDQALQPHPTA